MPHYIPSWEDIGSELFKKYPLQMVSPHPRFSFHTHYDKHTSWLDEIPGHRILKDGYAWWPVRIHPTDAAERSIQNSDIVRLYNDRGSVLCMAVLTERIRPGIIHTFCSFREIRPPGAGESRFSRPGRVRQPADFLQDAFQKCAGMTPNSCLIEMEKWR